MTVEKREMEYTASTYCVVRFSFIRFIYLIPFTEFIPIVDSASISFFLYPSKRSLNLHSDMDFVNVTVHDLSGYHRAFFEFDNRDRVGDLIFEILRSYMNDGIRKNLAFSAELGFFQLPYTFSSAIRTGFPRWEKNPIT